MVEKMWVNFSSSNIGLTAFHTIINFLVDIFKPLRGYGSLVAVVGTYLVSSLLHGLNYQLSGILLSLGIYTYVEYIFRQKLSKVLNACVSSKSCKPYCDRHRHTVRKLGVCFVNLFFTILSIYHLAYLGFLIDLRSDSMHSLYKSFERWRALGYESHYVVLATYVISWFLYFLWVYMTVIEYFILHVRKCFWCD